MKQVTISVSEQLLTSCLWGFLISISLVIILHVIPVDWNYTYDAPTYSVASCSYKCSLGVSHSGSCQGMSVRDLNENTRDFRTFTQVIADTFGSHSLFILLVGLIISGIIYMLRKVNFKIIKE